MSVVVHAVTKSFAGVTARAVPAVHDVSFEAPEGAVTSLIGPSGAGKSTLLRLIAGLEQPDAGRIRIAGVDVTDAPPQMRNVGLVFQSYALFEHMTVAENIAFGLDVRRPRPQRDEVRARVDELLRLVQLESFAQRRPAQLSGGQRQRVAFARALAVKPKVLLLDEPFGALDARVRAELREWLVALHEETRVTTLLVTHDQDEALEVSEHVVALFDGRVAQAGRPEDLYDRPASAQVATFLGASPVRIDGDGDGNHETLVRPEELALSAARDGDERAARVERVRVVGARVRITVVRERGERVLVDVSRREHAALPVRSGDRVRVALREQPIAGAASR